MSVHARVRLVSPSAGSSSRDSSAGSGALLPRDAEKKPPKQMKRKTSHTTNTTTTATSAMEATEGEETGQGQGDTDREQGRTWVAADPARAARPLAHLLSPAGGIGDGVLAPHLSHLASIPFAPILRPSAEEFGDSMAYISAVSRRYSNTHGLVQIVPPAGWQPSMTVDLRTRRSLAFDVRVQQVQKPERRVVQRTHPKVTWPALMRQADALHAKWTKERPRHTQHHQQSEATTDTTLEADTAKEREHSAAAAASAAGASVAASPASNAAPSSAPALGVSAAGAADSVRECMYDALRRIVLTYGYLDRDKRREVEQERRKVHPPRQTKQAEEEERHHHESEKKRMADRPPIVSEQQQPPAPPSPSPSAGPSVSSSVVSDTLSVEFDYWSWVYGPGKAKTLYATDVESIPDFRQHRVESPGAPTSACEFCLSAACRLVRAPSSWDLHSIARLPGGLLKYLGGTAPGVTDAMIYAGVHHSTFCCHNEDHYLFSVSYCHASPDESATSAERTSKKVWYGVPGSASQALERLVEKTICADGSDGTMSALARLPQKQTIFSPSFLHAHGVPVHKLLHAPNTFVLTFPQAYHFGMSESRGANITESVNFALPDWLLDAKSHPSHQWNAGCGLKATELYRSLGSFIVIPHAKFVLCMVDHVFAAVAAAQGGSTTKGTSAPGRKRALKRTPSMDGTGRRLEAEWSTPPPPAAAPPLVHDLQLNFLRRVDAELKYLISAEVRLRADSAEMCARLKARHLNAASRMEEEPAMEIGRLTAGTPSVDDSSEDEKDSSSSSGSSSPDAARPSNLFTTPVKSTMSRMRLPVADDKSLPALTTVHCQRCRTSCYLSYIDCTCGASPGEVLCLRHPDALCSCATGVVTYRFSIAELNELEHQLASVIESESRKAKNAVRQERTAKRKRESPKKPADSQATTEEEQQQQQHQEEAKHDGRTGSDWLVATTSHSTLSHGHTSPMPIDADTPMMIDDSLGPDLAPAPTPPVPSSSAACASSLSPFPSPDSLMCTHPVKSEADPLDLAFKSEEAGAQPMKRQRRSASDTARARIMAAHIDDDQHDRETRERLPVQVKVQLQPHPLTLARSSAHQPLRPQSPPPCADAQSQLPHQGVKSEPTAAGPPAARDSSGHSILQQLWSQGVGVSDGHNQQQAIGQLQAIPSQPPPPPQQQQQHQQQEPPLFHSHPKYQQPTEELATGSGSHAAVPDHLNPRASNLLIPADIAAVSGGEVMYLQQQQQRLRQQLDVEQARLRQQQQLLQQQQLFLSEQHNQQRTLERHQLMVQQELERRALYMRHADQLRSFQERCETMDATGGEATAPVDPMRSLATRPPGPPSGPHPVPSTNGHRHLRFSEQATSPARAAQEQRQQQQYDALTPLQPADPRPMARLVASVPPDYPAPSWPPSVAPPVASLPPPQVSYRPQLLQHGMPPMSLMAPYMLAQQQQQRRQLQQAYQPQQQQVPRDLAAEVGIHAMAEHLT